MKPILRLEAVSKSFGGVHAVRDVSLDVLPGTITSIIGPNGAGKTSLFNLIARIYPVTSGKIEFRGEDITRTPTWQLARKGLGRTFQNLALFRSESVVENLLVGCHATMQAGLLSACLFTPAARRAEAQARARVEDIIALLELGPVRDMPVGTLAYGIQKRVELGRALAVQPQLLLVDELVSGMNREETREVARLIRHVRAQLGITVLMIEHDMGIVMEISDQIAVLNFGHLIAQGSASDIASNPKVIQAYLGDES